MIFNKVVTSRKQAKQNWEVSKKIIFNTCVDTFVCLAQNDQNGSSLFLEKDQINRFFIFF